MIDPKLNKLPADATEDLENVPESSLTEEQKAQRLRRSRAALSVKDTIAGDAGLSVGAKGVDTSGVAAGAGAGAGMTKVTPGASGASPAPEIAPGPRGSGTTPRGQYGSEHNPSVRLDADATAPTREEIAARAYRCWHERGCPEGSPEADWQRAEEELQAERRRKKGSAASA